MEILVQEIYLEKEGSTVGQGEKKAVVWTQFSLSPAEALSTNAPIILQLVPPWDKGGARIWRGEEGDRLASHSTKGNSGNCELLWANIFISGKMGW